MMSLILSALTGASAAIVSLSSYFPTAHEDLYRGKLNPIARIGTESGAKVGVCGGGTRSATNGKYGLATRQV